MIKTNLLPPELQKKKAKIKAARAPGGGGGMPGQGSFAILAAAVILGFVLVDGFALYSVYSWESGAVKSAAKAKADLKKAQDSYDRQKKENEEKFREWNRMRDEEEIFAVLMPKDRIIWAEKLNMLSDLLPDGIYITNLDLTEKVEKVETEESIRVREEWQKKKKASEDNKEANAKSGAPQEKVGAQPPKVQKPIITQTLVIRALALWGEGDIAQLAKVNEFQKRMQEYETKNDKGEVRHFRDGFEQEGDGTLKVAPGLQEKKTISGVPVWQFQLSLVTKPFTGDTKSKTDAAAGAAGKAPAAKPAAGSAKTAPRGK